MSNLINLNNIISNQNITDNKQSLQLSEISSELSQAIQQHKSGMLEVLANNSKGFDISLILGDEKFSISLKNNILLSLGTKEKINIPVKINSSGKITPDLSSFNNKQNVAQQNEIIIKINENLLSKPELTSINLSKFVEQSIGEKNVDANVKQQILQIAKDINVGLKNIGSLPENEANLQNLQNVIKEMVSNPQNFNILKAKLSEALDGLLGKQLAGEISNKINQLYVIKTPLGETYFSSSVNIPVSEKVTLDILSQEPITNQKIKLVDEIIRNILPQYKTTPNIETLINNEGFKHLFELMQSSDINLVNMIMNKLPFQSDNLFENMFSLYKGVVNNDISRWLGGENIAELLADNVNGQKNIVELNNMMQGLVKETPSWRIIEMPFFDGNNLSSVKIALKKEKDKSEKQKNKNATRFVVETEFSKLGKFQFDGFCKAEDRNLDLIIRTNKKISDDFYTNIINLFKKSLYDLNYSGTIKINMIESFINLNQNNTVTEGIYI